MLHHTILPARAGRNAGLVLANSAAIALAMALAMPVNAQVLEEIVVTAQKREQNIQDIGIAVTAFTGDQIRELGFQTSVDIISMTTGVSVGGDIGGQRSLFMIRGVVQNDFADFTEPPVSVYVDDGYLAASQAHTFGMYEIERV